MAGLVRVGVLGLAAGIFIAVAWACQHGPARPSATVSAAPATTRAATTRPQGLQSVEYVRSGGFVGTHDVITVSPDGEIRVEGRIAGKRSGRLSREQREELARLFEGWDHLAADYPEARANDTFQYSIRYGDRTVTGRQLSKVPPEFAQVRDHLEHLAQGLPDTSTR